MLRVADLLPYGVRFAWRCGGFTLLEVLIAMVLLSIAFLGLSAMAIGTIRGVSHSENITTATVLARQRLEHIVNVNYDDIVPDKHLPENYNTMAGYEQFKRTVTITDNTPIPNTKAVTVEVVWQAKAGATRGVSLSTVIAAPGKLDSNSSL